MYILVKTIYTYLHKVYMFKYIVGVKHNAYNVQKRRSMYIYIYLSLTRYLK
jgi:hypothetical protein